FPGHPVVTTGGERAIPALSAAPWGSASILLISYAYMRMLGRDGMTDATRYAILNANYLKSRLEPHFPVLYTRKNGRVAHEMSFDLRPLKQASGIDELDVAKRLMDYGFHAPTVSFPVAGTIMVEPTESEAKDELDRFCEALIAIRAEIQAVVDGKADAKDNVLKNAPHTAGAIAADDWSHPYSREQAAFPLTIVNTAPRAQVPPDPTFNTLSDLVTAKMREYQVPGVAFGVVRDDRETMRGFGVTNVDNPLSITDDTVFPLASISKTVTTTAV